MTRKEFTRALWRQMRFMEESLEHLGMYPQIDWLKRSTHDQVALFEVGASKCDGVTKISAHQKALAADVYAIGPGVSGKMQIVNVTRDIPGVWTRVREHWESLGGRPMIPWDPCHFEG